MISALITRALLAGLFGFEYGVGAGGIVFGGWYLAERNAVWLMLNNENVQD